MLKVVLCDDNASSLSTLSTMLKNIFIRNDIEAKVEETFTNPDELLSYTKINDVDVLFLDIDLKADINGIEAASKFRETNKTAYIIFLTAHFEYAMLAYKVKTFDYLLKPFSIQKLEETVQRLHEDALKNRQTYIKFGNGKYIIRQSDIFYIEKERSKSIIHTAHSDIEVYASFNNLSSCLPENFVRCHKSYIVNTNNISKINTKDNIIQLNTQKIPYSEKFFDLERMILTNDSNFS